MSRFRDVLADRVTCHTWKRLRNDPPLHALNAALGAAKSEGDDKNALDTLRQEAGWVSPDALTTAVKYADRDDYLHERARRLLVALRDGAPVQSVAPGLAAHLKREGHLGRLPLNEAFALLAESVPRLRELEAPGIKRGQVGREVRKLVGPASGNRDPLLASETAEWVAVRYLFLPVGRRSREKRSHFEMTAFEFKMRLPR